MACIPAKTDLIWIDPEDVAYMIHTVEKLQDKIERVMPQVDCRAPRRTATIRAWAAADDLRIRLCELRQLSK